MTPTLYQIEFAESAAKEFRALPNQVKQRVSQSIDALAQNPRPDGVRKLQAATDRYRVRVSQYRVVYEINDRARLVRIIRIRHRRDVYR